jgi:hypothetical protein
LRERAGQQGVRMDDEGERRTYEIEGTRGRRWDRELVSRSRTRDWRESSRKSRSDEGRGGSRVGSSYANDSLWILNESGRSRKREAMNERLSSKGRVE